MPFSFPGVPFATELETAQEQLVDVRATIKAVLTGHQAVSANGNSWTRADLRALREREKDLEAKVGRLTRGGVRIQRVVPL